ncbi:hypothetical protein F2Q68_00025562 [Brassica cretica]|uniref:Uncharacterized protein n=1 Tax=Brassica cretica TaxID=69181 RepID=A0A8S9IDQ8_BRACR|nr:hypothetical protein F2Q68_00025562 [Brassica cretica]
MAVTRCPGTVKPLLDMSKTSVHGLPMPLAQSQEPTSPSAHTGRPHGPAIVRTRPNCPRLEYSLRPADRASFSHRPAVSSLVQLALFILFNPTKSLGCIRIPGCDHPRSNTITGSCITSPFSAHKTAFLHTSAFKAVSTIGSGIRPPIFYLGYLGAMYGCRGGKE